MIVCGVGLFLYKDTPTNNNNNNVKFFNIIGIGELLVVSCCLFFIYLLLFISLYHCLWTG